MSNRTILMFEIDMIAALGDLTSGPVLPRLRDRMLETPEGRQILRDRPKVNSQTVDMDKLSLLPENSFGRAYVTWLERCGVTPDTREPVRIYSIPMLTSADSIHMRMVDPLRRRS